MKIKSIINSSAKNILTEQELKTIIGGKTYICICKYGDRSFNLGYYTPSEAGCDVATCIAKGYCPNSWLCNPEYVEDVSGSYGSMGSGSGI